MKTELCVASLEAAIVANQIGVNRIETCINLEQGGLTPSKAMVSWIDNQFSIEQHLLIRLRAGGFVYTESEVQVMNQQILDLKDTGVAGFVVGAITDVGEIDFSAIKIWKASVGNLDLTFHRAFDQLNDWKRAIDQLVELGFKRILTSGSEQSVNEGINRLSQMVAYANGRIEIMAGGGVRIESIQPLLEAKVDAIHFSATTRNVVEEGKAFEEELLIIDPQKAQQLMNRINQLKKN